MDARRKYLFFDILLELALRFHSKPLSVLNGIALVVVHPGEGWTLGGGFLPIEQRLDLGNETRGLHELMSPALRENELACALLLKQI